MREITHLSPTRLLAFEQDPQAFYLAYLADNRPQREPQTQPMSVGSSFDAWVKSFLYRELFGSRDPAFEFEALFDAQVEPHNRDWAFSAGRHCFDRYASVGALNDLLSQLRSSVGEPRFELEVKGTIRHGRASVTLLGKPDLQWFNKHGLTLILDWKVNGYCSKYPPSPAFGYVRCRGSDTKAHPKCKLIPYKGTHINGATVMEAVDAKWATQLVTYAWLMGENVGGDFVLAVDQLVCNAVKSTPPEIRVAEHRCQVNPEFQADVFRRYTVCWDACTSGHFFRYLSLEESQRRCATLDRVAEPGKQKLTLDEWLVLVTR